MANAPRRISRLNECSSEEKIKAQGLNSDGKLQHDADNASGISAPKTHGSPLYPMKTPSRAKSVVFGSKAKTTTKTTPSWNHSYLPIPCNVLRKGSLKEQLNDRIVFTSSSPGAFRIL